MTRYKFEIQSTMIVSIDRPDKKTARKELEKDLKTGELDNQLRMFAKISKGVKEK